MSCFIRERTYTVVRSSNPDVKFVSDDIYKTAHHIHQSIGAAANYHTILLALGRGRYGQTVEFGTFMIEVGRKP